MELGNDLGYIAAGHCGAEYKTEYSESIDPHTVTSIDSNESPTTDERYPTSLDGMQPVYHSTLPDQYYPDFAFQQPNKNGRDDYYIGSWAYSGFHESFSVETVILSSNEDPTQEYDEDYWKERATEIAMQDERYSTHSFNNTPTPSIDIIYSASVDSHPHLAKRSSASIDTTPGTSIDIKAAASEEEKGNIPIPNRFTNTYIRSFAPRSTSHETEAEKMNAQTHQSEGTSRRSIRSKNPNSADKRLPSIDTSVSTSIDSHSKPKLSLSTKNMSIDYDFLLPDEFDTFRDQDGHARAMDGRILQVSRENIADIVQLANGVDNLFTQHPIQQTNYSRRISIGYNNRNWVTPMSLDKAPLPSIDRRYKCGRRAYDSYGAKKFRWEQKDEYGVYRDESGHARSATSDMIPVTKDDIRRFWREQDTELRKEIESMQHNFEKEATTSTSIDANKATSIDVKPQTSQIPAEPESLAEKKDEWEITYINTGINDVYNPLNNNVDWLSARIDLLQQELDTICMNDPQPAISIDISNIASINTRFAAMEDRLKLYEDMHDRFTSPIMLYLDTLSTQMMNVQKDIGKLNDQHDFQEENSTSIDRFRRTSLDGKKPTEHLPYTADTVDQITSKLYKSIHPLEDRLEKRCNDIYFPFDVKISGLDSQAEWLQKEVKAIQRKLASQHKISASIDGAHSKSIDSATPATIDRHLVASIDTMSIPDDAHLIPNHMESMQEQLNELSEYAYSKISYYQFSSEDILKRLKNISIAVQKMDERWTRNDEATRSFIAACTILDLLIADSTKMLKWINLSTIHTCLDCLKEPKLTSNTKPNITACLGAWYTWDRILQTSLEVPAECITTVSRAYGQTLYEWCITGARGIAGHAGVVGIHGSSQTLTLIARMYLLSDSQ
ncbi:hypothetical protein F2Q69_00021584 [Brassica cretica]|uniref:Uncharacterized protein n=1 Tax=Brassica cretica TaxID=69181 RepID=A0A8S9Q489_BRACR|nr:hypothetical protein F2Q69_00021584 [Brassica cretica]